MIDEFREDVIFLSFAVIRDDVTELHQQYLAAFYEEEFDEEDPLKSTQKRPMVPRKHIRAYLARLEGSDIDVSKGVEVSRTMSKAYSGFVHGASPQIMDMYGGRPPRFHVTGMLGTPREDEHRADIWNYFYRGILAFGFAALAFRDAPLLEGIRRYRDEFAKSRDSNTGPSPTEA